MAVDVQELGGSVVLEPPIVQREIRAGIAVGGGTALPAGVVQPCERWTKFLSVRAAAVAGMVDRFVSENIAVLLVPSVIEAMVTWFITLRKSGLVARLPVRFIWMLKIPSRDISVSAVPVAVLKSWAAVAPILP